MKGLVARIPRAAYLVAGGLLVLLLVVGSAYLLHTVERERRVEESALRHLDAVGHQVEDAVRAYGDSLANLRSYLREEWAFLETIGLPLEDRRELQRDGCAKLALISGLELVEPARCQLLTPGHVATLISPREVELRRRGAELIFALEPPAAGGSADQGGAVHLPVRLTVDLEQVLGPDAGGGHFEHLFLVRDGEVVLAHGAPGLRLERLDRLLPVRRRRVGPEDGGEPEPLKYERLVAVSGSHEVEVAGRPYHLVSHPLDLGFLEAAVEAEGAGRWAVSGLVPSGALRRRVLHMPPAWFLGIAATLVAAGLLFPFLRLVTLSRRDRLPLGDVFRAGLALLVGSGLLALALHASWSYREMADRADSALEVLTERIQTSFDGEVTRAHRQLRRLEQRLADGEMTAADVRPGRRDDGRRALATLLLEEAVWRPWPAEGGRPTLGPLPLFDDFMVVCPDGRQVLKWSTRATYTPFVGVADREYLRRARDGDLWLREVPAEPGDGDDTEVRRLFLQPLRSRTTGVLSTVVSAPGSAVTERFVEGRCPPGRPVLTLVTTLRSVTATVPPAGFGFAVVDPAGRVLFHSTPRRALVENLLRESGDDRELQAAMAAEGEDLVTLDYRGRKYRARVEPIESSPWSLLTFRELEPLQRLNLRAVLDGAALLTIFAFFFFALPGAYFLGFKRRLPRLLWPDFRVFRHHPSAYLRLAAALLAVACVELLAVALLQPGLATDLVFLLTPWVLLGSFVFLLLHRPRRDPRMVRRCALVAVGLLLLEVTVALPTLRAGGRWLVVLLLALVVTVAVLLTRSWPRRWSLVPSRRLYQWGWTAAALAALVTLAAVPAVVFFCGAFRLEATAAVADAQLSAINRTEAWAEELRAGLPPAGPRGGAILAATLAEGSGFYADVHHETRVTGRLAGVDLAPSGEGPEGGGRWAPQRDVEAPPCPEVPLQQGTLAAVVYASLFRFEQLRGGGDPTADPLLLRSPRGRFHSRFCADGRVYTAATSLDGDHGLRLLSRRPPMVGAPFPALPLLLASLLLPMFLGVRLVGRKVFLLEVPTLPSPQPAELRRVLRRDHLFLVGVLGDEESGELASPPPRRVSFGELLAPAGGEGVTVEERVARLLPAERQGNGDDEAAGAPRVLLLSGFAERVEDPEHNLRKLEVLKGLLQRAGEVGVRLLVVSTVDPRTVPPDVPGEDDAVQWDAALSAFTFRVRATVPGQERFLRHLVRLDLWVRPGRRRGRGAGEPCYGDLSERGRVLFDECRGAQELRVIGLQLARQPEERLTASEVVPAVLELAEGYYKTLWEGCSEDERAVLLQVAEEGVVNPRREWTAHGLLRRRLLTRDPSLRLMNRSFARFVRATCSREEVARWEGTEEEGGGLTVGGLVTAALVVVALFLFLTQPELFDISLAFVSAVALAIPALLRLVGGMGRTEGAE